MTAWRLTPAARRDLVEIWNYTAERWTIDQAERYVKHIEHTLSAAADGSRLARRIDTTWRIKSGRHVCYFRRPEHGIIDVVRILHERMDPDLHLA